MSSWEGSNYQAKREDAGKPLFEKEIPRHPKIPIEDAAKIWQESEQWNDDIRPHYFDGMNEGYLLAKKGLHDDLLSFIRWYNKLPPKELYNKSFKEIIDQYLTK